MAKSSINFQKTKANSIEETTRKFKANYLLPREFQRKNFYWGLEEKEKEVFEEQRRIYDEIKKGKRGKRPKFENCIWEAVCNLNENHTLEDVKELAQYIEEKYNIICTRIAIHRDEGHLIDLDTREHLSARTHYYTDEQGQSFKIKDGQKTKEPLNGNFQPVYNYHAHINFVTLKDGKQNWDLTKADLAKLQTTTAQILNMERGDHNSQAVRKTHGAFRKSAPSQEKINKEQEAQQEQIKKLNKELLDKQEVSRIIEEQRQAHKGKGLSKNYFQELSKLKQDAIKNLRTKEQLEKELAELEARYTTKSFLGERIDQAAINQEQKEIIYQQAEQIATLQDAIINDYEPKISSLEKDSQELIEKNAKYSLALKQLEFKNKELKNELNDVKQENSKLKEFITKAFDYIRKVAKPAFDFIKNLFTDEITAPLLNEIEKDKEFIEKNQEMQQRSNLKDYSANLKSLSQDLAETKQMQSVSDILNEPEQEKEKEIKIKKQR